MKKLESMAVIIVILFIVACIITIGNKVKKNTVKNFITIKDTTCSLDIDSISMGDGSPGKTTLSSYNRRNDPEIKAVQKISYSGDNYSCETWGWDHGEIVWMNCINGDFEYIKKQSKVDKKKCEDFLYNKGEEMNKKVKELQNQ